MSRPRQTTAKPRAPWLQLLTVAACAVLVYARVAGTGWLLDDETVLNLQLPYFSSWSAVLNPPTDIPQWSPKYYRPVVVASYKLDDALARSVAASPSDLDAARRRTFHASNVLLHAGVALIALMLARRMLPAPAAFAAALWFAVWPPLAEPVAWMTGRSDLWCTLLLLAGLLSASHRRWILAGGLALLAMLSKEAALVWLALLPILVWTQGRDETPSTPFNKRAVALVALSPTLLCLAWRTAILPPSPELRDFVSPGAAALSYLGGLTRILLWPAPGLSPLYGAPPVGYAVLALVLLAASLWLGVRAWRTARHTMLFALAMIWLPLVPATVAQLYIGPDRPLGERYVYMSAFGLMLIVMSLARQISSRMALVIAVPLALVSFTRADLWSDGATYWAAMRTAAPHAAEPAMQLGAQAERAGNLDQARSLYLQAAATARTPEMQARLSFNLGTLDLRKDDPAAALVNLDRAAALDPSLSLLPFQRGAAHFRLGQRAADGEVRQREWREAERLLRQMIATQPNYGRAHFLLGRLLLETGRNDEAMMELQSVIRLEPQGKEAQQAHELLQSMR